jgi:hypothetical protein
VSLTCNIIRPAAMTFGFSHDNSISAMSSISGYAYGLWQFYVGNQNYACIDFFCCC